MLSIVWGNFLLVCVVRKFESWCSRLTPSYKCSVRPKFMEPNWVKIVPKSELPDSHSSAFPVSHTPATTKYRVCFHNQLCYIHSSPFTRPHNHSQVPSGAADPGMLPGSPSPEWIQGSLLELNRKEEEKNAFSLYALFCFVAISPLFNQVFIVGINWALRMQVRHEAHQNAVKGGADAICTPASTTGKTRNWITTNKIPVWKPCLY